MINERLAPIYLKIPVMEGEIFCEFLILGSISTMVFRRIYDKRANFQEDLLKIGIYRIFNMENLHQFISKSLQWRVKYFGHL